MRFLMLFALLLAPGVVAAQALDQDAQAITTGNAAFDAGTSLGVTGVRHVVVENTGAVVVHIAWTQAAATAVDPALILDAGQSAEISFEQGYGPVSIWTKGVGAAGTVKVTASNLRAKVSQHLVDADALADSSRVRVRTFTIGHSDLTDADGSETETDAAGALPSGAVLIGYRKRVSTAFTGGTAGTVTIDCGFNGATDVLDDGQTIFTGVAAATYGAGANALPLIRRAIGGLTPQCTIDADDDVADLSAGSVSLDIFYTVPGAG
ncbi:MAG: hypothetical protein EKK55_16425 [Rhodocyclaceae bacterium]|nr:MAG: hypothetical protein EKK55_16425 [Rhodocyclaceae bacterium]